MSVADVSGVKIAGLLIDAGPVNSPVLLEIGTQHAEKGDVLTVFLNDTGAAVNSSNQVTNLVSYP